MFSILTRVVLLVFVAVSLIGVKAYDAGVKEIIYLYWECRVLGENILEHGEDELAAKVFTDLQNQLYERIEANTTGFLTQSEYKMYLNKLVSATEDTTKTSQENLDYWRELMGAKIPSVKDGDIIFHQSKSGQSGFIKKATHSKYTHCGVIVHLYGKPYVYEASSSVIFSSLSSFINRGVNKHYVVKRFNMFYSLSEKQLKQLKDTALKFKGKSYDSLFLWSDSRIYCSELVWKIFDRGIGREVGSVQKFKDMDFSDPDVKAELIRRFGSWEKVPMQEAIITPVAVMRSLKLYTYASN